MSVAAQETIREQAAQRFRKHGWNTTAHTLLFDLEDGCRQKEMSRELLRRELPALKLVQAVHVGGEDALEEARAIAELADAVLLDSGTREGPVAKLGGTGMVHDWTVSRRIVEAIAKPVILAGGLRPDNIAEAIRTVRPFGVDLCTGLRTADRLDEAKLAAFMRAVAAA